MTLRNSHSRRVLCGAGRWAWRCGRRPGLRYVGLALAAVVLAGCKSVSLSPYVSPRVTGRVVAADTRQPLANARVEHIPADASQSSNDQVKGGQRLDSPAAVKTDEQGRFALEAERALTFLQHPTLISVTASFQRAGYLTLRTNFTLLQASTNTPGGAPVVHAGDIMLHPDSP